MFDWRSRFMSVVLLAALAVPAIPAGAQTPPPPAQTPVPPGGSGLPPIPAVPPVPLVGGGPPLTLADAVSAALGQNFTIRLQALQVAIAHAQVAQAEAGIQPKVGFSGTYLQTWPPAGAGGQTVSGTAGGTPFTIQLPASPNPQYTFNLPLTYPLYSGNALQDQITIAQDTLRGTEATLAATIAQVILQVRQAYYQVQLTQGQVAAAQRAVDATQENVRVTGARVRVGTSPQFDLLQAQAQLAQFQQTLTQAKANAVLAQQNLDVVLDRPQTTVVSTAALGLPEPPQDPDALVQMALRLRPELAASQATIEAQHAAIDLAEAGLRPNITISAGPQVQTGDPTVKDPVSWSGQIQLILAILDGGLTKAKVDQARQQLAVAQTQDALLRQSIEQQVRTAYLNLQNAAETLRSAESQLVAAREQLRIANVRFQAGVGTQLEVVTAEQSRATADQAVVQAEYNYNLAIAQIEQAVGIQVKF